MTLACVEKKMPPGLKSFEAVRKILGAIEAVNILRKHQMIEPEITIFKSLSHLIRKIEY